MFGAVVRFTAGVAVVAAITTLGACGGGGGSGKESKSAAATTATTAKSGEGATTTEPGQELPQFAGDFDRVCTTEVGFPGATGYEPGPGLHPMVMFEDFRGEGFIVSSRAFPEGWAVKEDADFEDNAELKAAQLIVCSDRVKEAPTGKKCELDNKGEKVTLELVDATYEVKVRAATTGKVITTFMLEASEKECPYFAAFRKGDTTYVDEPSDDEYTAALKATVAP